MRAEVDPSQSFVGSLNPAQPRINLFAIRYVEDWFFRRQSPLSAREKAGTSARLMAKNTSGTTE